MDQMLKGNPANITFDNNLNLNFILPEKWKLDPKDDNQFLLTTESDSINISIFSPKVSEDVYFPNQKSTSEMFPFALSWLLPEEENVSNAKVEGFTIPKFSNADTYYVNYIEENRIFFAYFVMQSADKVVLVEGECNNSKEVMHEIDLFINSFTK